MIRFSLRIQRMRFSEGTGVDEGGGSQKWQSREFCCRLAGPGASKLADAAFYMGEKFSAQVMGLFQAPALVIPVDDFVSVAEVGTIAATARERRREAAAKADFMFKTLAERFQHVESRIPLRH